MFQGIAKVHRPIWTQDDRDKLEKVLLELWPNSKINPRKMYYYVDNVKGFYPEIVKEAIGRIVATQEYDRRPTINKLRTECQMLVRDIHDDGKSEGSKKDCRWCGYNSLVFVGLYIEDPDKCLTMDITGKNVLILRDGWAVRPDWGHELELPLSEYMVHCPNCSPPCNLNGMKSARVWDQRYGDFTEFRCRANGYTEHQWQTAYTLYHHMVSHTPVRPEEVTTEGLRKSAARFHEYLANLPNLGEFTERSMNIVNRRDEQPGAGTGDRDEWREEEAGEESVQPETPQLKSEEGEILHDKVEGLDEGQGL